MFDSCFTQFKLDFSENKLAVGEFESSDDIPAGGHMWRLNCFPRGVNNKDNNGEDISIFLKLASSSKNVKAIFEAFMMCKDGAPSSSHERMLLHVYNSTDWGWSQFVKRSDVESLYLTNGCATIMWGVIVMADDPLMAVPPSDIGAHLGLLLDSPDGSDISFLVDGERFPAHRAVLAARSPVFKAQLYVRPHEEIHDGIHHPA